MERLQKQNADLEADTSEQLTSLRDVVAQKDNTIASVSFTTACMSVFCVCLRPYSICHIQIFIWVGFSETIHSVRESGFANPVLMRIH